MQPLILKMKHEGGSCLTRYFSEKLARKLLGRDFDLILPVPSSRWSFAVRGHCAPAEIARQLGILLEIPADGDILLKIRRTAPQKSLPLSERVKNPQGAYRVVGRGASRKGILLVDDVLTTGSTASACADALREAGAKSVVAAVLARG